MHRARQLALWGGLVVSALTVSLTSGPANGTARTGEAHASVPPHAMTIATKLSSPADLRIRLEQLLGHHSALTDRLSRARIRGDVDFAESADAALVSNTEDMQQVIGSVYGEEAAAEFGRVWATHIRDLATYAAAHRQGDRAEMRRARRGLDRYMRALSQFLAEATNGAASAGQLRAGLRRHADHLLEQADAFAGRDYQRAYAVARDGYRHTFAIGRQLAAAISQRNGGSLPRDFDSPQRQLQSTLGLLLGEHVQLAVDTMRAGVNGSGDFPVAGEALNGNTRELAGAVESVFGARAADRFLSLWSDHIDAFVAYTQAVAGEDEAAKQAARRRFGRFNDEFPDFWRTATGGRLSSPNLAREFVKHEKTLLRQIDVFAAGDFAAAQEMSFEGYEHMFSLAAGLAEAIGDTVSDRAPRGGAQTGGAAVPLFASWPA